MKLFFCLVTKLHGTKIHYSIFVKYHTCISLFGCRRQFDFKQSRTLFSHSFIQSYIALIANLFVLSFFSCMLAFRDHSLYLIFPQLGQSNSVIKMKLVSSRWGLSLSKHFSVKIWHFHCFYLFKSANSFI